MSYHFTFEEKEILKVLARKNGCVVFHRLFFRLESKGTVCKDLPTSREVYNGRVATVSKKTMQKLYKQCLLSKRRVETCGWDQYDVYTVFELFSPALSEYPELEDIAMECALGV